MKHLAWLIVFAACDGGSSGTGPDPFATIDARCKALCMSDEPTCSTDVTTCEQECQLRVAGMQSLCATCLLENSDGGDCASGEICCPDAHFPNGALDCKDACATSTGVNPAHNPLCSDLCSSDEPTCTDEATACLDQCEARIAGVSGLCALCLLDDANGGTCSSGSVCCPSPHFGTTVEACADVCQ